MTTIKTSFGRRSFIKNVSLAGGGMVLGFSWFASCKPSTTRQMIALPKEWYKINGYLKIGENGLITIMSPNPEIGQNVKTSMPMIVAEELDIDWKKVIIEQADLDTSMYSWQIAGGSRSISSSWQSLRMAGATAKHMLKEAAAKAWNVPMEEITAENGILSHKKTNKSAHYGEMASAASKLTVPKEVKLKDVKDFKIIGTSKKNVDGQKIITGQPLFGLDYKEEGMLIAMIVHPPAFGLKLKSLDDSAARSMPGIKDVFKINLFNKGYAKSAFDATSFDELAVVVGNSTWEVLNAKKALKIDWEPIKASKEKRSIFGNEMEVITPEGLENTDSHWDQMKNIAAKSVKTARKDGNPEAAFKKAAYVLERNYSCPFLAHNPMEPMNFFANVTADKAVLVGPVQTPEIMEKSVSERLGLPLEKIEVKLTRMGGGFGRRLYGHFMLEAAIISQKMKTPVKLIYTREDDMTYGIYRPAYYATYKAAFDENKNLVAFQVNAGGIPEAPLSANRFPAGAIDNYLAEEWVIPTNISTGAFRAPRSNFMAGAEQSFLDEVAEYMGKDPIAWRLELFDKAKTKPVGEKNDYDAERYSGVLKLVKEKSGWDKPMPGIHRGVSAYFCHESYVAHVFDIVMENQQPVIKKVTTAVDCGIVINPDAAANLSQGAVVDAVGHSLYSKMTFKDGVPAQSNFNSYRLIRHSEAPKEIEVHFVKSEKDPTGMGEPSGPPAIGALANALYKATGRRFYNQPFLDGNKLSG
jgi:isoquinoline 1-oxidoreductase beta subunit